MAGKRILKLGEVHARTCRSKHLVRAYLCQIEIEGHEAFIHRLLKASEPTIHRVLTPEGKAAVADELRFRRDTVDRLKHKRWDYLCQGKPKAGA